LYGRNSLSPDRNQQLRADKAIRSIVGNARDSERVLKLPGPED